ncbi:MAG: FHA domain-containing protein [Arenicella sp.]
MSELVENGDIQISDVKKDVVIEICMGNQRTLHKCVLDERGIIIGRGWNCHLIVQDEHVESEHLLVFLNEHQQPMLVDMQTTNGSLMGRDPLSQPVEYQSEERIRIGETTIRIFAVDDPVRPATAVSIWQDFKEILSNKKVAFGLIAVSALSLLINEYFTAASPLKTTGVLKLVLIELGLLMGWALLMGFVGKLLRHEMVILSHAAFVALLSIVVVVVSFMTDIYRFNVQSLAYSDMISKVGAAVLLGGLVYGTLSFATLLRHRFKLFLTVLASASMMIGALMALGEQEGRKDWTSSTNSESLSMPPALLWRSEQSLDQFINDSDSLFQGKELDDVTRKTLYKAEVNSGTTSNKSATKP